MMRMPTACRNCRIRKRRCIVQAQGASCTICTARNLPCSSAFTPTSPNKHILPASAHDGSRRALDSHGSPSIGGTSEGNAVDITADLPDQKLCDELVDVYFDLIHDKQHALFHRPTFIAEQRSGQAPTFIVLAMMAIAARFSSDTRFKNVKIWNRGRAWAEASKRLFDSRSEAVSLTAIQGCAVLGNLAFIEGDAGLESLYGAQSIRMVQLLDLPRRLSRNQIQRETEIRVWWTIWMMDTWTSASVDIPRQLTAKVEYPRPMEESLYEDLEPGILHDDSTDADEDVAVVRESGLWAQMIPLTSIMGEIHILNKRVVNDAVPRLQVIEEVKELAFKLDYWSSSLPQSLQNNQENLENYATRGHGRIFAALHFGYHYHSQLLYYQFLHHAFATISYSGQRSVLELTQTYAARCKKHATELSNLMWKTNTTAGLECLWAVNGHLLVIASSIHLHTLLLDRDEAHLADARRMLEQNFEMLLQLQKYWPSLHFSMSRLKSFHRACQESMHESFDMDQWMLHFLQQYASPAVDRFPGFDTGLTGLDNTTPQACFQVENEEYHMELLSGTSTDTSAAHILQNFF